MNKTLLTIYLFHVLCTLPWIIAFGIVFDQNDTSKCSKNLIRHVELIEYALMAILGINTMLFPVELYQIKRNYDEGGEKVVSTWPQILKGLMDIAFFVLVGVLFAKRKNNHLCNPLEGTIKSFIVAFLCLFIVLVVSFISSVTCLKKEKQEQVESPFRIGSISGLINNQHDDGNYS